MYMAGIENDPVDVVAFFCLIVCWHVSCASFVSFIGLLCLVRFVLFFCFVLLREAL